MSDTSRLALPLLAAAQAQKHVTHNEALVRLDAAAHPSVISALSVPPAGPAEGDGYLVDAGASGDWTGRDGSLAVWQDGVWLFLAPFEGLTAFDRSSGRYLVHSDENWIEADGVISAARLLARSDLGAESWHRIIETELTGLSGASADTAALIPDRAIVLCVSTRTTTAISGAMSYDCGLAGEPSKFGGALGVAEGASNLGVFGPTAFYAPTAVRLTANGGAFTAGAVRIAVHCFVPVAPLG